MASQSALKVKEASIEMLEERRQEFYAGMITDSESAMEILEGEGSSADDIRAMSREDVQRLYQRDDIYDAIWFEGGLSEDNERHSADDYHEGYEAGAAMVLRYLHAVFGIEQNVESAA